MLSDGQCGDGWYQLGVKCFKYHNDLAGANFHDAMTICQYTYEATLVTIHSQEEFDFLSNMVFDKHHAKYSIWIGLVRVNNESFVWFDRSALNYTNWGPNEPNNWHSKNYCAVMSSAATARGKWFDVGCTTTYLVMCQKYLTKSDSLLNDSDISMADIINMQLESEQIAEQMSVNKELSSLRALANTNIVLTIVLFIVLIASILKYNYRFTFIRRNSFSSFDNSLVRSSSEI